MGDRRMVSRKIVESARFLKMPATSQNLYFHLVVNADDDGIVEAYPVLALTNANEDDLRVLASKQFVFMMNEDLVAYIEDWLEMNYFRADRKKDSRYKPLLLQLRPDVKLVEAKERSDVKRGKTNGQSMDGPWTAQPNLTQLNLSKSFQRLEKQDYVTTPKTDKSNRVIDLPEFLCQELEDYFGMLYKSEDDTRLFEISKSYLHHEMDRGVKASGVKRIRIHDIRHSHVAHLIELGFSPVEIAERLGHEGISVTYTYSHLYPSKQKMLADKLNEDRTTVADCENGKEEKQ